MKPLLWSEKLEYVKGSTTILAPTPVYPRLWEFITKDFKYLGYNKTITDAMNKWGKLNKEQLTYAMDTSLLPWLGVSSLENAPADGYYLLGNSIIIEEQYVKWFEENTGRDYVVVTKGGTKLLYVGVLILVGLVAWGYAEYKKTAKPTTSKSKKTREPTEYDQVEGFAKDVYGESFVLMRTQMDKKIGLIRK
jgi:hypothetical protein